MHYPRLYETLVREYLSRYPQPTSLKFNEQPVTNYVENAECAVLLNNGEPVLLPGIAAETKSMALAWDAPSISYAMAKASSGNVLMSAFMSAWC